MEYFTGDIGAVKFIRVC